MDFEQAIINTILKIYPEIMIQGRHLQTFSLNIDYATKSHFAFEINKLIALAFVPTAEVANHNDLLLESQFSRTNEEKLALSLDYLEDTWVGYMHRFGHRCQPRFHIPL